MGKYFKNSSRSQAEAKINGKRLQTGQKDQKEDSLFYAALSFIFYILSNKQRRPKVAFLFSKSCSKFYKKIGFFYRIYFLIKYNINDLVFVYLNKNADKNAKNFFITFK